MGDCSVTLLDFFFLLKLLFIAEKPRISRSFTVELLDGKARMYWSKPTGSYTIQTIETWTVISREKREAVSECMKASNCEEEVIPIEQTSYTTDIDPDKEYKFILVLYDWKFRVAQFEAEQTKKQSKHSFKL